MAQGTLMLAVGPQGTQLRCDQQLLARHSAFVRQYLEDVKELDTGDAPQNVLPLPDLEPDAVSSVLEALETSKMTSPAAELEELCRAAAFLQLQEPGGPVASGLTAHAKLLYAALPEEDKTAKAALLLQLVELGDQYELVSSLSKFAAGAALEAPKELLDPHAAQWPASALVEVRKIRQAQEEEAQRRLALLRLNRPPSWYGHTKLYWEEGDDEYDPYDEYHYNDEYYY